jgi:DNA-binding response OmpR family regulator
VLLLEDERDLAFLLERNLRQLGCEAVVCHDLAAARRALDAHGVHDLLLLDVNLPDGSGFELLRELRARGTWTPAVFLTARSEEADRLTGFAVGGDDYVSKPFSMAELMARVGAIVRRARQGGRAGWSCAAFRVDFDRYLLVRDGREVPLTYMEAELLRLLAERAGQPVSRNEILDQVWGHDRFPTTRTVDMHVLNLRKKLEPDPARPRHLLTVHGVGYKLVAD